jgi:hypothetical protein
MCVICAPHTTTERYYVIKVEHADSFLYRFESATRVAGKVDVNMYLQKGVYHTLDA